MNDSSGVFIGGTTSDVRARGLNGGYAAATDLRATTITPGDGGMARDGGILIGSITTVTGARGGVGWVRCTDARKKGAGFLLLLQCPWLPPPPAPAAPLVVPTSSTAAPAQTLVHGREGQEGYTGSTLPLLVNLTLPSLPATVAWLGKPSSSSAASPAGKIWG